MNSFVLIFHFRVMVEEGDERTKGERSPISSCKNFSASLSRPRYDGFHQAVSSPAQINNTTMSRSVLSVLEVSKRRLQPLAKWR